MSDLLDTPLPHTGELLAGRYRLIERIGSGAMGRVYRAHDETLARDVAVKLFPTDPADETDALRRASEARVLAALNHPSLVTLFDARVHRGDHAYLVMELVPGPTLRQRIDQLPLNGVEVSSILEELANALAVVHKAGVVHRDIKPANVLLRPMPRGAVPYEAVLADFGVAQLADATRLTSPGMVIGTAAYLAPEQVRGESAVAASDIYALGLLAIEALTGIHPFGGDSVQATIVARLSQQPAIPSALGYRWKSLLAAMTALDPAARPSAEEVADRASRLGAAIPSPSQRLRRDLRAAAVPDATAPTPSAEILPPTASELEALFTLTSPTSLLPDDDLGEERRRRIRIVAIVGVIIAGLILAAVLLASALAASAWSSTTPKTPAEVVEQQPTNPAADPSDQAPIAEASQTGSQAPTDSVPGEAVTTGENSAPASGGNPQKGPGNNNGKGSGNGKH